MVASEKCVTVTLHIGQAPPLSQQGKGDREEADHLAGGQKECFVSKNETTHPQEMLFKAGHVTG